MARHWGLTGFAVDRRNRGEKARLGDLLYWVGCIFAVAVGCLITVLAANLFG
jgi:hypothetical protein